MTSGGGFGRRPSFYPGISPMRNIAAFGSLLLLSTALTAPAALAQTASDAPAPAAETQPVEPVEEGIEISGPGAQPAAAAILLTGRHLPNANRRHPVVISVLSTKNHARTGTRRIP